MNTDTARLNQIRQQLAAIDPADWTLVSDGEGCFAEARGPMGELVPVFRFHPGASADEMQFAANAPAYVRFLLGLVDRAIAKLKPRPEPAREQKNYAAEASMRCKEPAFRVFLEAQHGLERPLTDERVNQKVRSLLGVQSRRDLNDSERAAAAWRQLRDEFETWRRAQR